MLKKRSILLPAIAILWFWSLAFYEQRVNNPKSEPRVTERFGCAMLYRNSSDRARSDWYKPGGEGYECHNPMRIRLFAATNIIPLLLSAAVSILLRPSQYDEVMFDSLLVSSVLILFWWA